MSKRAHTMQVRTLVSHTQRLSLIFKNNGDADRRKIIASHRQHVAQFSTIGNRPDVQREGCAAGVHELIDQSMAYLSQREPAKARRIACRKGCAHCCLTQVDITHDEAKLLHLAAQMNDVKIDVELVRRQAATTSLDQWQALSPSARRCVFLAADDTCSVYEHRPSMCRTHQVLDTAAFCDTLNHPGDAVLFFISASAEIAASAAFAVWGSDLMARQLLATWPPNEAGDDAP